MDNTVFDRVLIHKHIHVNKFGSQVNNMLGVSNEEGNSGMLERMPVVVDEFHELHCVCDFRIKH